MINKNVEIKTWNNREMQLRRSEEPAHATNASWSLILHQANLVLSLWTDPPEAEIMMSYVVVHNLCDFITCGFGPAGMYSLETKVMKLYEYVFGCFWHAISLYRQ